jgi:hypothetical protein
VRTAAHHNLAESSRYAITTHTYICLMPLPSHSPLVEHLTPAYHKTLCGFTTEWELATTSTASLLMLSKGSVLPTPWPTQQTRGFYEVVFLDNHHRVIVCGERVDQPHLLICMWTYTSVLLGAALVRDQTVEDYCCSLKRQGGLFSSSVVATHIYKCMHSAGMQRLSMLQWVINV